MRLLSIIVSATFLLLSSCSSWSKIKRGESLATRELSQKALFEYLKIPNPFYTDGAGNGPFKIDPELRVRDSLVIHGKVYFNDPMDSELLKKPLPNKSYRLKIPDSLANRYALTSDSLDYEHDYAMIYQFSPLLPTIDPEIYLMEIYMWFNYCQEEGCVRDLTRQYLRFKNKDRKIVFLDRVGLKNQNDFIGFGGFQRKKMEEALPGEKIIRFGW